MSDLNDGGPAFPVAATKEDRDYGQIELKPSQSGMSLRDYFAAHCPSAVIESIAGTTVTSVAEFIGIPAHEYECATHWVMAEVKARFVWADAMLAERSKGGAT